jgi:phosphatidylglycerophosphate synthase
VLPLVAVGAGALVLLVASLVLRRPVGSVPDAAAYLAGWSRWHGGLDAGRTTLVRRWLTVVYRLARPLARAGVAPGLLTTWGLVAGALTLALADLGGRWALVAAAAAVLSAVLDGVDGAVAVLTDRATRLGFVLDSVVDRVVDGLYLMALWRLGAPPGTCVAAGAALALLEYTRARAGSAGMSEIGIVTAGERPTRVILTVVALGFAGAYVARSPALAALGAWGTLAVSLLGLAQLLTAVRRQLS